MKQRALSRTIFLPTFSKRLKYGRHDISSLYCHGRGDTCYLCFSPFRRRGDRTAGRERHLLLCRQPLLQPAVPASLRAARGAARAARVRRCSRSAAVSPAPGTTLQPCPQPQTNSRAVSPAPGQPSGRVPSPGPPSGRVPSPGPPRQVTPARLPPAGRNPSAPGAQRAALSQTSRCFANFFPLALPCVSHTLLAPSLLPSPQKNFWSSRGNISRG